MMMSYWDFKIFLQCVLVSVILDGIIVMVLYDLIIVVFVFVFRDEDFIVVEFGDVMCYLLQM